MIVGVFHLQLVDVWTHLLPLPPPGDQRCPHNTATATTTHASHIHTSHSHISRDQHRQQQQRSNNRESGVLTDGRLGVVCCVNHGEELQILHDAGWQVQLLHSIVVYRDQHHNKGNDSNMNGRENNDWERMRRRGREKGEGEGGEERGRVCIHTVT